MKRNVMMLAMLAYGMDFRGAVGDPDAPGRTTVSAASS